MVCIGTTAIALALLMCWYCSHRKKTLLRRMEAGVYQVKLGLYGLLCSRFITAYGQENAGWLAAAVTNELFSDQPANPQGREFLQSHEELVERELSVLRADDTVRNVVTQAVRVKATIAYARGVRDPDLLRGPLGKLEKFGILVPGGDPPKVDTFLLMAEESCGSCDEETSMANPSH